MNSTLFAYKLFKKSNVLWWKLHKCIPHYEWFVVRIYIEYFTANDGLHKNCNFKLQSRDVVLSSNTEDPLNSEK